MKRLINIFLLTGALAATAQDLSTEITVDRTIVPAERAASRLTSVHPQILSQPVAATRIDMAEYDGPGSVTRSARVLAPAAWADTFALSPYRGYVAGGYFPAYNLALSAGYRILQSADTRLGVWLQFDGLSYKGAPDREEPDSKMRFKNNTAAAGVDFDHRFGRTGVLTAGASYSYGNIVAPSYECVGNHDISMADAHATWYGRAGSVGYHAGARLRTFGVHEYCAGDYELGWVPFPPVTTVYKKGTEVNYEFAAGVAARLGRNTSGQRIGIELKADMLSRPDATAISINESYAYGIFRHFEAAPGGTLGVISATPYYTLGQSGRGLNLRLGARVDISTGGSGKKFHIAPAAMASYSLDGFSVYARAGGGEVLNTQRSLYDITPFFPVGMQQQRSHVPLTLDGGVCIGPFAGIGVEIFGGWARANDWLMPAMAGMNLSPTGTPLFLPVDIKGAHAGVRASYDYRSIVHVNASVEFAPQKEHSGYYLWRDRAKMAVKAEAAVRPVARLELKASYELRTDRAAYGYYDTGDAQRHALGNSSLLGFGATYSITPALDVFARGENLLACKYLVMPGVPAQGVHGLLGASFRF